MNSTTLGDADTRIVPILMIVRFPLDPLLLLSYCHKEGRMFCWRLVYLRFLVMLLLAGSFNAATAQTIYREIGAPQNQQRQTAVIGLLGEFHHCATYEISSQNLDLNKVIAQTGGMTPNASGIIRIIRGGRISQDLFYSPNTDFPLMHGDVLIGLESSANDINVSSEQNWNGSRGTQQQKSPQLIQIAILNLVDRPVVFGVPAEIADLAGILRCLRQPLEQYPQIAQAITVIPPKRIHNNADFKTRKLTSKFASGTVLVLGPSSGIDLTMIPHNLPSPRRLQAAHSPFQESPNELRQPASVSLEKAPFRQTNSTTEVEPQIQHGVTHPEDIPQTLESTPLKTKKGTLQLNGPVLQQTAASLTLVPKPNSPQAEENAGKSVDPTDKQQNSNSSTVPDLNLTVAPAPPVDSVQVLSDDDLPKFEEFEETENSSWPQWVTYLLLAVIAGGVWKYLQRRAGRSSTTSHTNPHTVSTNNSETEPATIITNWDSLPPLPNKSLLEQLLENDIPVIEETPQIPTQTFIYGRHQTRSARVDQKETLKGPHFTKQIDPGPLASEKQRTTNSAPVASEPPQTEKKLKAPAFRFDRSHPGTTQPAEEKMTPTKTKNASTSNQKQSVAAEANQNSGILDRVLQAMQGVMPK
tara:strand:- start:55895 stop:57811 length:1917 start_codon:yes stop_codon:yes gene_type:complete